MATDEEHRRAAQEQVQTGACLLPGLLRALRPGALVLQFGGARTDASHYAVTFPGDKEPTTRLTSDQTAAITRALADPRRYAMLQQIAGKEGLACTGLDVHGAIGPATISHHLKELQAAGLIRAEREGRGMRLSFCRERWEAYLRELGSL